MSHTESYTNNNLSLDIVETDSDITIIWKGKSSDRNPSEFLSPILSKLIITGDELNKSIILDFTRLEYMNSSTITPISKMIETCKKGTNSLKVIYKKEKKWQELSFDALKIFQTPDNRISFTGN